MRGICLKEGNRPVSSYMFKFVRAAESEGYKTKKSRWDSGMNSFPSFYLIIRSWPIRPRPHVFWYFWIRTFFFLDTASVHTYPVNAAYESAPFWIRSSLERGNFWIRYESGIVWTLNPGIFIRWRNKIEPSSLPWILYSRQSKMQISRALPALYDLCSVAMKESWVLEWIQTRIGYLWRANSIWIRIYVRRGAVAYEYKKSAFIYYTFIHILLLKSHYSYWNVFLFPQVL